MSALEDVCELNDQELEVLVDLIVAQSTPTPRTDRRVAHILQDTPVRMVATGRGDIAAWRLGEGPALLLTHGANDDHVLWAPLMDAAVARGHAVVVLDMPGHGHSAEAERGVAYSTAAVRAVAEALGPVHTVIGHSVGAIATIRALAGGLAAQKAVLFAPALTTRWDLWIQERTIVAPEGAPAIAIARARERLKTPPPDPEFDYDVEAAVRDFIIPALFAHCRDDPHWSWRTTEAIAAQWPGARTHYAQGLGHRGVARDRDVIRHVLDFVEAPA